MDGVGNVFVGGEGSGGVDDVWGMFVAKLDPDGHPLWSRRFGHSPNSLAVAADAWGSVAMTGKLRGTADFGGGPLVSDFEDVIVAKLDSEGDHSFSARFGDPLSQFGEHVVVDSSGDVLVSGRVSGTVDFGGGSLAPLGYGGDTSYDMFLLRLSSEGTHLRSKRCDAVSFGFAIDPSDCVLVTGESFSNVDFGGGVLAQVGPFVAKFGL